MNKRVFNLRYTPNKLCLTMIGGLTLTAGVIGTSRYWLPDDTPIKNTWQSHYYSDYHLQVKVTDVLTTSATGETYFTLLQEGKTSEGEKLKLSLHGITQEGTLVPIENVSQYTMLNEEDNSPLQLTGYSFFWDTEEFKHLQVTVTVLDEENKLKNQQVIYLDYRRVNQSDQDFLLSDYVTEQLTSYKTKKEEVIERPAVQKPTAITPETSDKAPEEVTGDDIQTPNEEVQNPTGTLQQSYVIEESEEVQSDHVEEIVETETPQYTLADLEYQLSKAKEELTATPDDEALKQKVADLEKQIQEMKEVETETPVDNGVNEGHE